MYCRPAAQQDHVENTIYRFCPHSPRQSPDCLENRFGGLTEMTSPPCQGLESTLDTDTLALL